MKFWSAISVILVVMMMVIIVNKTTTGQWIYEASIEKMFGGKTSGASLYRLSSPPVSFYQKIGEKEITEVTRWLDYDYNSYKKEEGPVNIGGWNVMGTGLFGQLISCWSHEISLTVKVAQPDKLYPDGWSPAFAIPFLGDYQNPINSLKDFTITSVDDLKDAINNIGFSLQQFFEDPRLNGKITLIGIVTIPVKFVYDIGHYEDKYCPTEGIPEVTTIIAVKIPPDILTQWSPIPIENAKVTIIGVGYKDLWNKLIPVAPNFFAGDLWDKLSEQFGYLEYIRFDVNTMVEVNVVNKSVGPFLTYPGLSSSLLMADYQVKADFKIYESYSDIALIEITTKFDKGKIGNKMPSEVGFWVDIPIVFTATYVWNTEFPRFTPLDNLLGGWSVPFNIENIKELFRPINVVFENIKIPEFPTVDNIPIPQLPEGIYVIDPLIGGYEIELPELPAILPEISTYSYDELNFDFQFALPKIETPLAIAVAKDIILLLAILIPTLTITLYLTRRKE